MLVPAMPSGPAVREQVTTAAVSPRRWHARTQAVANGHRSADYKWAARTAEGESSTAPPCLQGASRYVPREMPSHAHREATTRSRGFRSPPQMRLGIRAAQARESHLPRLPSRRTAGFTKPCPIEEDKSPVEPEESFAHFLLVSLHSARTAHIFSSRGAAQYRSPADAYHVAEFGKPC